MGELFSSQDDAGEVKQEVYQYTQFAVSEYREKVAALVKFRNQFAECPFVCKTITTPDNVQVRIFTRILNFLAARSC